MNTLFNIIYIMRTIGFASGVVGDAPFHHQQQTTIVWES